MNKVNARLTTCEQCSKDRSLAVSQYENGDEFAVCYGCGKVIAKHRFDAQDYILDLMRDGITGESEIADNLANKLHDEYACLGGADVDSLAKLMTRELYDKAMFECQAEARDQEEESREFREAMAGRY